MSEVVLSAITTGDHPALYDILSDPAVRLPFALFSEPHFNRDTIAGWCAIAEKCNSETSGIDKFYAIKHGPKVIGYFGGGPDTEAPAELDRWEIGYFLAAPYHGRGIITGLLGEFKKVAETQKLAKVFCASVSPDNHASRRVLEKQGFVKQRVDRNWAPYIIHQDGSYLQVVSSPRVMDILECRLGC